MTLMHEREVVSFLDEHKGTALEGPRGTGLEEPIDTALEEPKDTGLEEPTDTALEEPKDTAVDKAINVLSAFPPGATAVGVTELAQKLGLPKSTVFRALKVLTRHGLVETVGGRYRLGHKLFELGKQVYEPCLVLWDVLSPVLLQLSERTHQTVALGALRNNDPVVAGTLQRATLPRGGEFKTGASVPSHCTALGKVLIAHSPAAAQAAKARGLKRMTPRTIVDPVALNGELCAIRRGGLSFEESEFTLGAAAVAIALLDPTGYPIAAITIVGRSPHFDGRAAGNALRQSRADASALLRSHQRHNRAFI